MYTMFAVLRPGYSLPENHIDEATIDVVEVYTYGTDIVVYWINELALLLPDSIEVIALDNNAGNVKTIGDLKKYYTVIK